MFYVKLGERQENLRGEPLAFSRKKNATCDHYIFFKSLMLRTFFFIILLSKLISMPVLIGP
jgi:hypothetical protein